MIVTFLMKRETTLSQSFSDRRLGQLLKRHGMKVTPIRLGLMKLLRSQKHLWSAGKLHETLQNYPELKGIHRTTVYRNLKQFEASQLVRSTFFDTRSELFEWDAKHALEHHNHIRCRHCHAVEMLDSCVVEKYQSKLKEKGYTRVDHHLEFSGICFRCQN